MATLNRFFFLLTALFVTGFGGIASQTILLRELLIVFSGNEFSIGIIIGSWVICEAGGALVAGRWRGGRDASALLVVSAILLFSLLFPVSIYCARISKHIAGIPPEVGAGLVPVMWSSFVVLFPTAFLHGLLFTLFCVIYYPGISKNGETSVGKVYAWEMLGTMAGGVLLNYLFIPCLDSFTISLVVAAAGSFASLLLCFQLEGRAKYGAFIPAAFVAALSLFMVAGDGADHLHKASLRSQWSGKNLLSYENSVYQNIVVLQNENQYTFFSDGTPIVTTPVPDIAFVEEFAHFPLLAHPCPRQVLIISGGVGGVIHEVLKHPTISLVDYVEIDPLLLKTLQRFPSPLTEMELHHPAVRLHYRDGRIFVRETRTRYDIVLLGLPPPQTLRTNRFFTVEFFSALKGVLSHDGIIALTLPGSQSYYSRELKELNISIFKTLQQVFPYTFVLPGDLNLFLASPATMDHNIGPMPYDRKLKSYGIATKLLGPEHLAYRFEENRLQWFESTMKGTEVSVNRDFSPHSLFYNLAYQNFLFSSSFRTFFNWTKGMGLKTVLLFIGALLGVLLFLKRGHPGIAIPFAIATTGFTGMLLELIIIFAFQVAYGFVFFEIGILITACMAGMASGSLFISFRLTRIKDQSLLLRQCEAALVLFSLLLLVLLLLVYPSNFGGATVIRVLSLVLLFFSGLLTGMEFPLAYSIHMGRNECPSSRGRSGHMTGLIYGLDLLGGWIGGFLGSFFLLPVAGLIDGCIMLAALKGASLLLLSIFRQK